MIALVVYKKNSTSRSARQFSRDLVGIGWFPVLLDCFCSDQPKLCHAILSIYVLILAILSWRWPCAGLIISLSAPKDDVRHLLWLCCRTLYPTEKVLFYYLFIYLFYYEKSYPKYTLHYNQHKWSKINVTRIMRVCKIKWITMCKWD